MREFVKVVSALLIAVSLLTCIAVWLEDRPGNATYILRVGAPILCCLASLIYWRISTQPDKVPDYLGQLAGKNFFDRSGLCFAFFARSLNGVCYLDAYYQNRHEQSCQAKVVLRPAKGFLKPRKNIETITFEIQCGPAAFGVARVPVPLFQSVQGKQQEFEVGATVEYPEGKGSRLRYRDGIVIRANATFRNKFGTTLKVIGALGGTFVLTKPASITIELPNDVAQEIPTHITPMVEEIWKLGDPPLSGEDSAEQYFIANRH